MQLELLNVAVVNFDGISVVNNHTLKPLALSILELEPILGLTFVVLKLGDLTLDRFCSVV